MKTYFDTLDFLFSLRIPKLKYTLALLYFPILIGVLVYSSYSRVERARDEFQKLDTENRIFLEFVLQQYINLGVEELDDAKLSDFLQLKYHSIRDAKAALGDVNTIRNNFIEYQRYLYV